MEPNLPSDSQMLKVFPEAKKWVKNRVKEIKSDMRDLEDQREKWKAFCYKKFPTNVDKRETAEFWTELFFIDGPLLRLTNELTKYERMLVWKEGSDSSLIKAKQFPITDLLDFNKSGFAKCIFHNEKTPSLKYDKKTNRVYCFSCNQGFDSVDVYMKIHNVTIQEAIKSLS